MKRLRFLCVTFGLLFLCACLLTACKNDDGTAQNSNANGAVTACDTHTPGEWFTVREEGETQEGLRKRLCTVCGEALESEGIPATGSTGLVFYAIGEEGFGVKAENAETAEQIVIPKTHQNKPVIEIGERAFAGYENLKSITLPTGLKSIAASAFDGCKGLETLTLPNTLAKIDTYAFRGCTALSALTLPGSVATLGHGAFSGCAGLTKISFSKGLLQIGNAAFADCTSLVSVTLPEGLLHLGGSAFSGCIELTSLTLPSGLQSIGGRVSFGCSKLRYYTYNGGNYLGNENEKFLLLEELADKSATAYTVHSTTKFICALALDTGILQSAVLPKTLRAIGVHHSPLTYYYAGTAAEWESVTLCDEELYGSYVPAEKLYFYCDTVTSGNGNYWHYVMGKPTKR